MSVLGPRTPLSALQAASWATVAALAALGATTLPPALELGDAAAAPLPRNEWLDDAVAIRMTDNGLEFVTEELEGFINEELPPIIEGVSNIWLLYGCTWSYSAYISYVDKASFNYPAFTLDPRTGYLDAHLDIPNFSMDFMLEGDGLFCADHYTCWSNVTANRLVADARVYLDVINGEVVTRIEGVNANVSGYEYDTSWDCFIIELVAEIMQSTIEGMLEETLETVITDKLPDLLNDLFAGLDLSGDVELFGTTMGVDFLPHSDSIEESGGTFNVAAANRSYYGGCNPEFTGSRYVYTPPVDYPDEIPEVGGPYDIAISVTENAWNSMLYMAYDTGALCIQLDENSEEIYGISINQTTTDLQRIFPTLYAAYPDAPLRVDLIPQNPPLVSIGTAQGRLNGQMEAIIRTAYVDLYVWNENAWHLALRVDTEYGAELLVQVNQENKIRIVMSNYPEIEMTILEEPLVPIGDRVVEKVIPFILRIASPLLFASLDYYPLPEIFGYGYNIAAIVPDGPEENLLSLYGTLYSDEGIRPTSWGSDQIQWSVVEPN